jgi:hypothetical protein
MFKQQSQCSRTDFLLFIAVNGYKSQPTNDNPVNYQPLAANNHNQPPCILQKLVEYQRILVNRSPQIQTKSAQESFSKSPQSSF